MAILQNTTVSGSLVITGDLTARQFILSSSVTFFTESFASGSTRFGDSMDDTMVVTGSLRLTGSLAMTGSATVNGTASFQTVGNNGIVKIGGSAYYSQLETNSDLGGLKIKSIWGGANSGVIQLINGTNENIRMHITDGGNIGIGTTVPLNVLDVRQPSATMGNYQTIQAFSTDSAAINLGGGISLGGYFTSTTSIAQFASIVGRKENGTSANYDGYLAFGTNAQATGVVERMRITSAGNVGIGITNPNYLLHINSSDTAAHIQLTNTTTGTTSNDGARFMIAGLDIYVANREAGAIIFETSDTEKMRITSTGRVGIGTNSPGFDVTIGSNAAQKVLAVGAIHLVDAYIDNAVYGCRIQGTDNGVDGTNMQFITRATPSGGFSTRMTITTGGNIGAPSGTNIYNASDRRLKRNITPLSGALNKVLNLNPVMFNWIQGYEPTEEDKDMLGFIAQDMQEVVPEAVESFGSGDTLKVGELEITSPLRVNEKFIIPVLVKAIQELSAKVTALETT
jgi:hypothetical protein